MDSSFASKRPFDRVPENPNSTAATASSTKRRHHQPPPSSAPPSSIAFRPPVFKLASGETLFRILCPATKTGGVIGKGGAIIRQVREETGARIRIDDPVHGCEERVIVIVADSTRRERTASIEAKKNTYNVDANSDDWPDLSSNWNIEDDGSPAQHALVRVFERIIKVDGERSGIYPEHEKADETKEGGGNGGSGGSGGASLQGPVACRLLAPSNQVGCVLGRGGKIVERIRNESGAQIRVLSKDQIPACASPGDELIQITGSFSAVRKALLSVSSCLQDNPRADAVNYGAARSSGIVHETGMEKIGSNHRVIMEEEVVFKLLCQVDKVGSLIGKGGSIIRALQSETCSSIKIADVAPDSDEKIVVISARENSDQRHSPAQDAVIRVHSRIAEIGFEPGAAVVARLLVNAQQIGCLLGKGGIIIAELRRTTGASIRIFPKEQAPKYGYQNDEVVQVIGSLQSVQDALFQITSRLRETVFPVKPHGQNTIGSMYIRVHQEMPPPPFRPRHDPTSPGHYPSPAGLRRGIDHVAAPAQPFDPQSCSHGMDHTGPKYFDRVPYAYGNERAGYGSLFDGQSSPRGRISQAVADAGGGFTLSNDPTGSGSQTPNAMSTTVEVVIPHMLLCYVYGENSGNLSQIRQISGANVVVHDPRPGSTEGVVVVSGMPDQIHAAQSLIHGFIFAELPV